MSTLVGIRPKHDNPACKPGQSQHNCRQFEVIENTRNWFTITLEYSTTKVAVVEGQVAKRFLRSFCKLLGRDIL